MHGLFGMRSLGAFDRLDAAEGFRCYPSTTDMAADVLEGHNHSHMGQAEMIGTGRQSCTAFSPRSFKTSLCSSEGLIEAVLKDFRVSSTEPDYLTRCQGLPYVIPQVLESWH